jgi:hypothetical protein
MGAGELSDGLQQLVVALSLIRGRDISATL